MEEELDVKDPLILETPWKNKRGQPVRKSQKFIIINLYKKLKQTNPEIYNKDAVAQLSEQTGIGICSVRKTLLEYKRTGAVTSPNRKKYRPSFKEKIDEFGKNAIRRKVHELYMKQELPTLKKILQVVNTDENLPTFKRSTFRLLLKELNFTYTYTAQHRNCILTETEDIIVWRRNYLRAINRYRVEGRQIYYLDETWINASDVSNKIWIDKTMKSKKDTLRRSINSNEENKRLIILHIGSAAGFVPGGLLCFESKKHTADYHDEIDGNTFLEWFKSILPSLDDNAVIVIDNAPYHSVKVEELPNSSWKKNEIVTWLEGKGKEISETMVKAELLQIVQQQKNRFDKYLIDEIAEQDNKTVLRLPPYHCELNPMEMVWSMIKECIRSDDTFKIQDIKQILEQAVDQVTVEHWSNFVRLVRDEEKKMWETDYIADRMIDEIPPLFNGTDETDSEISGSDY